MKRLSKIAIIFAITAIMIGSSMMALSIAVTKNGNDTENASALWTGDEGANTHKAIADGVTSTCGFIDPNWWWELGDHANDPDAEPLTKPGHFLNNPFGAGADDQMESYAIEADSHFKSGQLHDGFSDLAHGSHYLMDLGTPIHRNMPTDPNDVNLHTSMEKWIWNNWVTKGFDACVKNQPPSRYLMDNPTKTIEQLGEDLSAKAYTQISIWWNYWKYGSSSGYTESQFVDSIKYCLRLTAQYLGTYYAWAVPKWMTFDEVRSSYPYSEVYAYGHVERLASFSKNKINIHLELVNGATYGDTGTDYMDVTLKFLDGTTKSTRFTNLPQANGGYVTYDAIISNDYPAKKISDVRVLWHQWTTGEWRLYTGAGFSSMNIRIDGLGVVQTVYGTVEARGASFGYDAHDLSVMPATKVKAHIEIRNTATSGTTSGDYLYIYSYYRNGAIGAAYFYDLPAANGGTLSYNAEFTVGTQNGPIDHFEFLWHQSTNSGSSYWYIQAKTTFYWDTSAPGTWPA